MARLRFRARLASAASILLMGAGMAAPVMALKVGAFQPAPAATVAVAHAPGTTAGGHAAAATTSNTGGNTQGWQTNGHCNPKNHYCGPSTTPTCTDDPVDNPLTAVPGQPVPMPTAASCAIDDDVADPYCPDVPSNMSQGICPGGTASPAPGCQYLPIQCCGICVPTPLPSAPAPGASLAGTATTTSVGGKR